MITVTTINGRRIAYSRKTPLHTVNNILYFRDGDWFNVTTGEGVHRHGWLSISGTVRILQRNGTIASTTPGQTYNVTH